MSIHESSIIHPSAKIDRDVQIGPFCVIGENVEISSGSKLLSHVVIKGPSTSAKHSNFQIPFVLPITLLKISTLFPGKTR